MQPNFDPLEWANKVVEPIKTEVPVSKFNIGTDPTSIEDIEYCVKQIEKQKIDLTIGYDNWRNLGFALSDELKDKGRSLFHRISSFNDQYNFKECDEQYDKSLISKSEGITIASFFHLIKQAGIKTKREKSNKFHEKCK